jgi:hypothetical protein
VDTELFELIREYQALAARACALLREHLQLENAMMWRRKVPQVGTLGDVARYAYHGTGVTVVFSSGGNINFDFGFDGRCDGFSPWKLADVAQQLGGVYGRFAEWLELKNLLDAAVREGSIQRPFLAEQDDLYYLAPPSTHACSRREPAALPS